MKKGIISMIMGGFLAIYGGLQALLWTIESIGLANGSIEYINASGEVVGCEGAIVMTGLLAVIFSAGIILATFGRRVSRNVSVR